MHDQVTIPKDEYDSLLKDSAKLRALEDAGVDNWEWYGDAMATLYKEEVV